MVLRGELETVEVTDARSGSLTVPITITPTFTPSSLSPELPKVSLKLFFSRIFLSSRRIRKVWQKRKCGVKFGCLTISHSTVRMCGPELVTRRVNSNPSGQGSPKRMLYFQINRPPAKLNLLTCQVRPNPEDKKTFDLVTSRFISNV